MRAQDLLPDDVNQADINGVTVRKGTVGAFLANARIWLDQTASAESRQEAETHMAEALAALRALGLFDVFTLRDATLQTFVDRQAAE